MSERIVYLNGQFLPEAEARLSIYDAALTMGDMAFEVTRTFHGRPFRLRQHLQRLAHSLQAIRTNSSLTIEELEEATLRTLAMNQPTEQPDVDWNIIHNISRGPAAPFVEAFAPSDLRPTVVISCYPLVAKLAAIAPFYDAGLDLVVPPQRAIPRELFDPTIKTRSRIHLHVANFQAHDISPGAWAVLATPDGRLTEGTSENLFLIRGGVLLTPRGEDVLSGVTRGVILDLASRSGIECQERDVPLEEAAEAEEMFLTSTSIGLLHARSFQGRIVGGRGGGHATIGPITARLREALVGEVGLDFAEQARHYARRLINRRGG